MPTIGGDHIGVEISDQRWATQLGRQPGREAAVDRRVLTPRASGRRPRSDSIGLGRQIAVHDRGRNLDLPHSGRRVGRDQLHIVDADVYELDLGELQLRVGGHDRLSLKPAISGHVKPTFGQNNLAGNAVELAILRSEKGGFWGPDGSHLARGPSSPDTSQEERCRR